MKLMVFDVGGTEIKYCVMDESLEREKAGSVPTPMGSQEEFFDLLCSLYEPYKEETEGIAMCLPGFIDSVGESGQGLDMSLMIEGTEEGLFTLLDWMESHPECGE